MCPQSDRNRRGAERASITERWGPTHAALAALLSEEPIRRLAKRTVAAWVVKW
jgi:hypothetical protein